MIDGFFTKKETESKSRPGGKKVSCVSCGLYKDCTSPKMKPYGNFKKKILNIGEAPGEIEDQTGKPFQGKTGKLLQRTYKELGIDLFEDCLNINAVNCRPADRQGHNRAPSNAEVDCCRKQVFQIIEEYKPILIVLLGNSALYSLIGHRWRKDLNGIVKWRGFQIPDQDFKTWLCPVFHPSYVERALNPPTFSKSYSTGNIEELIWKQDLWQAFRLVNDKIPFPHYVEPTIEIIENLNVLKNIKYESAFDYETTGLKPHATGHRIVCVSIADSENHAYVFLMPKTKKERQPFIDYLTNPKLKKIAQNMKFEHTWTKIRLGVEVEGWEWDTMLATHVFDNRPGITGLKFQVYVQFGIVDYTSEVDSYLGTDTVDANAINHILELIKKPGGTEALCKYCGLDSIYELRLANRQRLNLLPF
jgi:DNA polymerase